MNACHRNSIIIAERVINTKPVRSMSYMEYLRNRDTVSTATPSELAQFEQSPLNFTPDSSTGLVENRFENFGSPPVSFEQMDSVSESVDETPEWLKADIAGMDFIPIDALQGDRKVKAGELLEQSEVELAAPKRNQEEENENQEEIYNVK